MIKLWEDFNLEGYTFILPSVAVANVAQLCVDLLISNLNLKKVGQLWCASFIPIACSDPYDFSSTSLGTASDFYVSTEKKVVLLQIRSPYVGKLTEFFEDLTKFIKERGISKTIILTSSYDYTRSPEQIDRNHLNYLVSDNFADANCFEKIQWKKHDQKSPSGEIMPIEGSGYAASLHKHFSQEKLSCVLLYCYCSEGDNLLDALSFTKQLNDWLPLLESKTNGNLNIKYPPSWCNLFGNCPPTEIY